MLSTEQKDQKPQVYMPSPATYFKPIEQLVIRRSKEHQFIAPDGTRGRQLANLPEGNMSCYEQDPGIISHAQLHRVVSEVWQITHGVGEIWLKLPNGQELTSTVLPGVSIAIPAGTAFQFKNLSETEVFKFTVVTMPPWPGAHVVEYIKGPWDANIEKPDNSLNNHIESPAYFNQKMN